MMEEKRNRLNLEIRSLLSLVDMIDGQKKEYSDYKINSLNEEEYLDEQIKLIEDAKNRIINLFKE